MINFNERVYMHRVDLQQKTAAHSRRVRSDKTTEELNRDPHK